MISTTIIANVTAQQKAAAFVKVQDFLEEDGIYTKVLNTNYSHKWIIAFTPEDHELLKQLKRD